jgi:hypothetical protein
MKNVFSRLISRNTEHVWFACHARAYSLFRAVEMLPPAQTRRIPLIPDQITLYFNLLKYKQNYSPTVVPKYVFHHVTRFGFLSAGLWILQLHHVIWKTDTNVSKEFVASFLNFENIGSRFLGKFVDRTDVLPRFQQSLNSIKQKHSWISNSCSTGQKIISVLWTLKEKNRPLDAKLNHFNLCCYKCLFHFCSNIHSWISRRVSSPQIQ